MRPCSAMGATSMSGAFTLKCCGCGNVETRPSCDCLQQPMCSACYCPMILEEVVRAMSLQVCTPRDKDR
jgi:hypothetical protein